MLHPNKGQAIKRKHQQFSARFFLTARRGSCRHTLCISKLTRRSCGEKDPLKGDGCFFEIVPYKKGAGRRRASPRMDSRFAMSDYSLWLPTDNKRLRREDLTSLGTAAGKNLAAVGSSHSLPETVDLGSVTTAGLIGTLHIGTPPVIFRCSTAGKPTAAKHSY